MSLFKEVSRLLKFWCFKSHAEKFGFKTSEDKSDMAFETSKLQNWQRDQETGIHQVTAFLLFLKNEIYM